METRSGNYYYTKPIYRVLNNLKNFVIKKWPMNLKRKCLNPDPKD